MSRFGNLEFGDQRQEHVQPTQALTDEALRLRAADTAFRRGDFEQALRAYAQAMEANPLNPAAWVGQVRMLIELGAFAEANVWADKALERFPRDPEVLAAKAVVLARCGDAKAALAFSDAAVEMQSGTPYVWVARGDVLLARAEKRAEYCFTKAFALGAGDWLWPWLASRIHYFYRRFSLAMKLVSQALALESAQAVIWLQMGRCQLAVGLASAAQESFTHARELDPNTPAHHEAQLLARRHPWWTRFLRPTRAS